MNYKDLPEGYLHFLRSDHQELVTPEGKVIRFTPVASDEEVAREAWKHRAVMNPCTDWQCPVCRERGLIV